MPWRVPRGRTSSGLQGLLVSATPQFQGWRSPLCWWEGAEAPLCGRGNEASCADWTKNEPHGRARAALPKESGPGPFIPLQRFGNLLINRPVHAHLCTNTDLHPRACLSGRVHTCVVLTGGPSLCSEVALLPGDTQGLLGIKPVGPARKGLPCSPSLFF